MLDIQAFQTQQAKQEHHSPSRGMSVTKRCFVVDLHTETFLANSRETVRVLGVALTMQAIEKNETFSIIDRVLDSRDMVLLVLDDGTASIDIWTPRSMIDQISVKPGETLDCILRLRQNGSLKRWYAETLIRVADSGETESLRWLELSRPSGPNECQRFGYPRVKMNAAEAFRLISVQYQIDGDGVTLEDLALVMQQPTEKMEEMIQELQLTGQIYKNQEGHYVPL